MVRKKPRGWEKHPHEHNMARLGIETRSRPHVFRADGRYSPPIVDLDTNLWGFEIREDGSYYVRLGNWTTAGWHWSGDETDLVLFFSRISDEDMRKEIIESLENEGVTFDSLKEKLVKATEDESSVYGLSGDNRRWHFGEDDYPDFENEVDYFQEEYGLTKEEREKLEEKASWDYLGFNFEEFHDGYGKEISEMIKGELESAEDWEDMYNAFDNLREDVYEYLLEMQREKEGEAVEKAYKDLVEEGEISKPDPRFHPTIIEGQTFLKSEGKKNMDFFEKQQLRIAKDTLKMPDTMANVMGGMSKEQAREIIKKYEG